MTTTTALALGAATLPQSTRDPRTIAAGRRAAANDPSAWGACEIRLVADRGASLRAGSTHKVYRDWRCAVIVEHGHPTPGTALCTVPIDPGQLASRQTPYTLLPRHPPGARGAAGAAAFAWASAAAAINAADPFAAALAQVHQVLRAAGWVQDATVPTCYTKSEPTALDREEAARVLVDPFTHGIAALESPGASRPAPDHRPMAWTAPPVVTGVDGWETDGGRCDVAERLNGDPNGDPI